MKKIISFILFSTCITFSQVSTNWFRTYNGTGNLDDAGEIVKIDNTGNTYVCGWSEAGVNNQDIVTIKYNSAGIVQWTARFNGAGSENDRPEDMIIDNSGNVYICGGSYGGSNSSFDAILLKYNSAGTLQWNKSYNGSGAIDQFNAITMDNTGNIYVTGNTYSSLSSSFDCITIKYNSAGVSQWQKVFSTSGSNDDEAYAIGVDHSGRTIIGGISDNNALIVRYTSAGVQDWATFYDGPGSQLDRIKKVFITADNSIISAGISTGNGTDVDFLILKYNASGGQAGIARYNSPGNYADMLSTAGIDVNGNIYAAGYTYLNSQADFRIVKYSPTLSLLWFRTYNGSANGNDYLNSMTIDQTGNVYVTGDSFGGSSHYDFLTLGYDYNGNFKWEKRENGSANSADLPTSIFVDNSGNVCVTGSCIQSNGKGDYMTYKYSSTIGINMLSGEIPSEFTLNQNYPNPFNPQTKIKFSLPKQSFVILKVFDSMGKETESLVSSVLSAGNYEAEFNSKNLSSGVYFYTLTADGFAETKKMVLIK